MMVIILDILSMLLEGVGLILLFYKTIPFFIGIYDKDKTKIYKNLEFLVMGFILLIIGLTYTFLIKPYL